MNKHSSRSTPPAPRLQKLLATLGYGSRRTIEQWIKDRRILLNGKPAILGVTVNIHDRIQLDGREIKLPSPSPARVIMYHKPIGEVCSHEGQGAKPVFDSLPQLTNERWISIGRLDINTSGLLLFTNHGELAHHLMHPSVGTDREYSVRVFGRVNPTIIDKLKQGVEFEEGWSKFSDIVHNNDIHRNTDALDEEAHKNHWFTVCLTSGKNREVRRLWESQGLKVNRLKRVRYGPIFLPSYLPQGQWIDLTRVDCAGLFQHCELPIPTIYTPTPQQRQQAERRLAKMKAHTNRHKNNG